MKTQEEQEEQENLNNIKDLQDVKDEVLVQMINYALYEKTINKEINQNTKYAELSIHIKPEQTLNNLQVWSAFPPDDLNMRNVYQDERICYNENFCNKGCSSCYLDDKQTLLLNLRRNANIEKYKNDKKRLKHLLEVLKDEYIIKRHNTYTNLTQTQNQNQNQENLKDEVNQQ